MCKAFSNILEKMPNEMVNYLYHKSRSENIQQKIFQEYVSIIEKALPFHIYNDGKSVEISSIGDERLNLFYGISVFHAPIKNGIIKNNTEEFYIGGRKATYYKPFFIGKILDIVDNESILLNMESYDFNSIKIKYGNKDLVKVIHLRVPPHYQLGSMVYLNRIRKNISDEIFRISGS